MRCPTIQNVLYGCVGTAPAVDNKTNILYLTSTYRLEVNSAERNKNIY